MSKPIAAGDLVMVVKPMYCCGNASKVGVVFRVQKIAKGTARCPYCNAKVSGTFADRFPGKGPDVSRLIRIDPPALPESVETEREVAV